MSHKHGADLGGIRTVEDLRARCRIDEETGCWHWGLAIVQGVPCVHFHHPTKGRVKFRGRRAALVIARGKDLPRGHVAFASACCTAHDCVNPDHCRSGNRIAAGEALAKSGAWKGLPRKIAAAEACAQKRRKLTAEAVEDIRLSSETDKALSVRHGVSSYAVWACRNFKTHRPKGASVFSQAGLGSLL